MSRLLLVGIIVLLLLSPAVAQERIAFGETINSQLNNGEQDRYQFDAEAGQVLLISASSRDFDTLLTLQDADGQELVSDDDGGQRTNSMILGYTVPADGAYTIVVNGYAESASGDYTLVLDALAVPLLSYGQLVDSSLTEEAPGTVYNFQANPGDMVVGLLESSESTNIALQLIDPTGELVGISSYVDGSRIRVGPIQIEQPGVYTLLVSASSDFSLALDRIQPVVVGLNQTVQAVLTPDTRELYFAFQGQTGQVVDFVAESEADVTLNLLGPLLYSIASSESEPVLENIYIQQPQTYYLIVAPVDSDEGQIIFSVREAALTTLGETPTALNFGPDASEYILGFDGVAGETVRLIVTVNEMGEFGSPTLEVLQDGETLANISMRGTSRVAVDVTIPQSSRVNVRLAAYVEAAMDVALVRSP
jgi:hypothetical protein